MDYGWCEPAGKRCLCRGGIRPELEDCRHWRFQRGWESGSAVAQLCDGGKLCVVHEWNGAQRRNLFSAGGGPELEDGGDRRLQWGWQGGHPLAQLVDR